MNTSKPTDDPHVQRVMVVNYESIRRHMADPKQLPFIGDVRKGVDQRLMTLQTNTAGADYTNSIAEDRTRNLAKALIGLYYYYKHGKVLPMN